MTRNLHRRIEVAFPVYEPHDREEIKKMLQLQLQDNTKAVCLDQQLRNCTPERGADEPLVRAQVAFYEWLRDGQGNKKSPAISLIHEAYGAPPDKVLQLGNG